MYKRKYKTIDLCAGIGGIRHGFEMTDMFENVLSAEIDKDARATYKHLYKEEPEHDLTANDFKNKAALVGCDVLLAGFPCQTFSSAGKQLGFKDTTKGTIFFHILDIIQRCSPKAVLLENVENLLCHDEGRTLRTIIESLEFRRNYKLIGVTELDWGTPNARCEYSRQSFLRNTKDFGLPQNRPRVFIMGFSRKHFGDAVDLLSDWQLPTSSDREIFKDVNAILEPIVEDHYYMASGYLATLKNHKKAQRKKHNGFGYVVVNDPRRDGGKLISNTILATGGSGKECNLVRQPKEGIAGKILSTKKTPLNDEGIRVMTPTEWGRLQGFIGYAFLDPNTQEEKFAFPEGMSDSQKYKQFGNSVSVPVINEMAKFMLKCFDVMEPRYLRKRILELISKSKFVTRHMIEEQLSFDSLACKKALRQLVNDGALFMHGQTRGARYTRWPGVSGEERGEFLGTQE